MIKIKDDYSKEKNSFNKDESDNTEIPEGLDAFDINILEIQARALLVMVYAYLLEYIGTLQGIELIKRKYRQYNVEPEPNPDATIINAAALQVASQAVLVEISRIQLNNTSLHFKAGELNNARSANTEILLSDAIEEVAYILNFIGVKKLAKVNFENEMESKDE